MLVILDFRLSDSAAACNFRKFPIPGQWNCCRNFFGASPNVYLKVILYVDCKYELRWNVRGNWTIDLRHDKHQKIQIWSLEWVKNSWLNHYTRLLARTWFLFMYWTKFFADATIFIRIFVGSIFFFLGHLYNFMLLKLKIWGINLQSQLRLLSNLES